jgi:hypothetical protein
MSGRNSSLRPSSRRIAKRALTTLTIAVTGMFLAACGNGARPGVANVGSNPTTTQVNAPRSGGNAARYSDGLAYAQCMRSHGEPNFPDPSVNGSIQLNSGVDPSSSVFQSAQTKCQKQHPGGGFPSPGTTTTPTPAALAHMFRVAQCMRARGVSQFPDPTTKVPSKSAGFANGDGVVSDRDGVILEFPSTLDMQSTQFTHAAAVCKFALTNH